MRLLTLPVLVLSALAACAGPFSSSGETMVRAADAPVSRATPAIANDPCAVLPRTVLLGTRSWRRDVPLPTTGRMFGESHLATTSDPSPAQLESVTDRIEAHLMRSAAILRDRFGITDQSAVYAQRWARQWTPAEGGGLVGQGSISVLAPPDAEMFVFNMMHRRGDVPPPGERWLLCNAAAGRCAVAAAGYEIGPTNQAVLGGVQRELQFVLGATNATPITVHGPLRDQSLPYGPVTCRPS